MNNNLLTELKYVLMNKYGIDEKPPMIDSTWLKEIPFQKPEIKIIEPTWYEYFTSFIW